MSVQQAEAQRQYDSQLAFQREQLDLQRRLAEETAAAEQRRHEEMLAAQQRAADEERARQETYASQIRQRDEALAAELRAQQDTLANDTRARQEALSAETLRRQEAMALEQRTAQERMEAAATAERDARVRAAQEKADRDQTYVAGRNQLVDRARAEVDGAFSGFDDAYFQEFKNQFLNFYKPQISKQFSDSSRDLTLGYAAGGNLNSSAAARSFGELSRARADAEADVAGKAEDSARDLRGNIEGQRADALSSIFASGAIGDPNLPDGVTDVNSQLGRIGNQLSSLTSSVRARAAGVKTPSIGSLGDALSGFRSATDRVRRPVNAYARGGYYSPTTSRSSASSYVVA